MPLALETMGPTSNVSGLDFIKDLGRHLTSITEDKKETCYLLQRISITIQRFNAIAFRVSFTQPELSEYKTGPEVYLNVSGHYS